MSLWLTVSIASAVILLGSITIIPEARFGVVLRFKNRTGRVLKEGLRFTFPFIEQVKLFSIKLEADMIETSFVCKDEVEVFIKGPLQWRPDPKVVYLDDKIKRVRFVEMKEETIVNGIKGEIQSTLGRVGGGQNSEIIYEYRREVENLVNCILRLEYPPHLFPERYDWAKKSKYVKNGEVDPENLIKFFDDYAKDVRELLDKESESADSISPIEERYGIDIEKFALANVNLTERYKAIIEQKQQADARAKAAETLSNTHVALTKKYIAQGLSPDKASNRASLALSLSTQGITSIEGLEKSGALPFFQIQTQQTPKKGGEK